MLVHGGNADASHNLSMRTGFCCSASAQFAHVVLSEFASSISSTVLTYQLVTNGAAKAGLLKAVQQVQHRVKPMHSQWHSSQEGRAVVA